MSVFNPGDVLVLKSGGPKMTVIATHLNSIIECVWAEGTAVARHQFHEACLKKYEEEIKNEPEQETEVKRGPGRPRGQGRTDL